MLHSRIRPLPRRDASDLDDIDDSEGLFSSFLPHLFPDDAPSFHGDPGQTLLYSSLLPQKKELEVIVPGYPGEGNGGERGLGKNGEGISDTDETRRMFAHYLWSSALIVAEGLERMAAAEAGAEGTGYASGRETRWTVKGEKVLELGAGTALPSIVSLLANASSVTITDHPSSSALGPNGSIRKNLERNVPETLRSRACIHPHEWGDLNSLFAMKNKGSFTRIIAADCLWIKGEHENLVRTILWFLSDGKEPNGYSKGGSNGKVWVVGGFHTGREVVASFFETAVTMGLEIEEIWERDINAKDEGDGCPVKAERSWSPLREGEGPDQRRRWHVVAFLKRKGR